MIYFKTLNIEKTENQIIEKAIRNFSLKRNSSLDFKQSSSYVIEENKYFLGLETEKHIRITRLRTPFENLFPKLILRFDKSDFSKFQIRCSFPSNILFILLIIAIVLNLIELLMSNSTGSNIGFIIFFSTIFCLMTFLEIKITERKLKKAIVATEESLIIEQIVGN